jgi:hypothetical protein
VEAIHGRKSLASSKLFFSNCRLSKYIEIYTPPQLSPTSLTHPRASHPHPTGSATSHDYIRPPVVSPTVPRPTEDLTRSGLESGSVSSFSSDISDLCSPEHSPPSDHQQWPGVLAGDGGSGGHFPPSSFQPPIHNNIASSVRRRKSCTQLCTLQTGLTDIHPLATNNPPDASPNKCRIPDCTYNAYYDFSEQEQTEYCGQGHELWVWFDFDG